MPTLRGRRPPPPPLSQPVPRRHISRINSDVSLGDATKAASPGPSAFTAFMTELRQKMDARSAAKKAGAFDFTCPPKMQRSKSAVHTPRASRSKDNIRRHVRPRSLSPAISNPPTPVAASSSRSAINEPSIISPVCPQQTHLSTSACLSTRASFESLSSLAPTMATASSHRSSMSEMSASSHQSHSHSASPAPAESESHATAVRVSIESDDAQQLLPTRTHVVTHHHVHTHRHFHTLVVPPPAVSGGDRKSNSSLMRISPVLQLTGTDALCKTAEAQTSVRVTTRTHTRSSTSASASASGDECDPPSTTGGARASTSSGKAPQFDHLRLRALSDDTGMLATDTNADSQLSESHTHTHTHTHTHIVVPTTLDDDVPSRSPHKAPPHLLKRSPSSVKNPLRFSRRKHQRSQTTCI